MLAACGSSGGSDKGGSAPPGGAVPDGPSIESFAASNPNVFVGDRTQLTAVFTGTSATIEGLGPVQTGNAVDTPALSSTTRFTLTVEQAGRTVQATVTVAAGYRNRLRQLPDAPVARTNHVAMALADGSALVMGGNSSEALNVPDSSTTARFDPVTEHFTPGPDLAFSALDGFFTVAFPLRTGFLLAGGGINGGAGIGTPGTVLSQVFDPAGQQFTRVGNERRNHAGNGGGALLADGRVLMTGGGTPAISDTETYDPDTRTWTSGFPMGTGRRSHTATLLHDGRVLIAGGLTCCTVVGQTASETFTTSAELYDPRSGEFTPTGSLGVGRAFHRATLLADGRVLLSGGLGPPPLPGAEDLLTHAEVYDPATGQFSPAGVLQVSRAVHSAVLLTDGRVLVVGGIRPNAQTAQAVSVTELYDPQANQWNPGPTLDPAWFALTATMLGNGKVLLFGGENTQGFPQPSTLLFE